MLMSINTCWQKNQLKSVIILLINLFIKIDYINWIELIKFRETRNYVQRVLENVNVYKYLLAKKPLKIRNYFVDKPHY